MIHHRNAGSNQVDGIISGSHNPSIEGYNRVTAPTFDCNPFQISFWQPRWRSRMLRPWLKPSQIDHHDYRKWQFQFLQLVFVMQVSLILPKALLSMFPVIFPSCEMEIKNILTKQNPTLSLHRMIWQLFWLLKLLRNLVPCSDLIELTFYRDITLISQPLKQPAFLKKLLAWQSWLLLQKIEGKEVATTGYFLPYLSTRNWTVLVWVFYDLNVSKVFGLFLN